MRTDYQRLLDNFQFRATVTCELDTALAQWQVLLTGAEIHKHYGRAAEAAEHQRRSLEIINRLANSLEPADPLRLCLLGAPIVRDLQSRARSNQPYSYFSLST